MRASCVGRSALLLALAVWIGSCAHRAEAPRLDRFAPALALPSVGPAPFDWSALRGRVVLVHFFATWCFPCIGGIPLLQKLQDTYAPKGFRVVGVGMDLEGAQVLEPFVEQYRLSFPMLIADQRIRQGQSPFGVITSLPSMFLFGKDGRLITAFTGLPVAAEIEQLVSQAVAE
jgi:thiol-disulfide isomerase/thioredoxin